VAAPTPTVSQQGLGVVPADLLNTFVQVCASYAQMRTFPGLSNMAINVLGGTTPGDGGQGLFYWNSTSTSPDNGHSIIVPYGYTTGAWIRLI
jgi:hypothetical protein